MEERNLTDGFYDNSISAAELEILIQSDPTYVNANSENLLHLSTQYLPPDKLSFFLDIMPDMHVNFYLSPDKDGYTAAHFAIMRDDPLIAYLVFKKFRKNAIIKNETHDGDNPLHLAINKSNLPMVDVLSRFINLHALNKENKQMETPFKLAEQPTHKRIKLWLDLYTTLKKHKKNKNQPPSLPQLDAMLNHTGSSRELIRQDALLLTSRFNFGQLVKRCLIEGVNPDCSDWKHNQPLHYFASAGNSYFVNLMLKRGAKRNAFNLLAKSPLSLTKDPHCIQLLIETKSEEQEAPNMVSTLIQDLSSKSTQGTAKKEVPTEEQLYISTLVALSVERQQLSVYSDATQTAMIIKNERIEIMRLETDQNKIQASLIQLKTQISGIMEGSESNSQEQLVRLQMLRTDFSRLEQQQNQILVLHETKLAKLKAHKEFKKEPNLWLFYRTMNIKLEEVFIGCKAVASGIVKNDLHGTLGKGGMAVQFVGKLFKVVPIIGDVLGSTISGIGKGVEELDLVRHGNKTKKISKLGTISEIKLLCEKVSRILTKRYAEQILQLRTPEGELLALNTNDKPSTLAESFRKNFQKIKKSVTVNLLLEESLAPAEQLAEFGVLQMFQKVLLAEDFSPESIYRELISAATTPPDEIGKLERIVDKATTMLGEYSVHTKEGIEWNLKEIYYKPGLRTPAGTFSGNNSNHEKYGYCLAETEEALSRKLQLSARVTPVMQTINHTPSLSNLVSVVREGSAHIANQHEVITKFVETKIAFLEQRVETLSSDSKEQQQLIEAQQRVIERIDKRLSVFEDAKKQKSSPRPAQKNKGAKKDLREQRVAFNP